MASKKNVSTKLGVTPHSPLATAILNIVEPIQAALDADFPVEMGHEMPSRQDRGLKS
jgi:hypothetical protein